MLDPNPLPPGLHQYSVVVSTPFREMKFTAPTRERHDIWLNVQPLTSVRELSLTKCFNRPSNTCSRGRAV